MVAFLFCKPMLAKSTDSTVISVHIEQNMNSKSEYLYSVNLFIHNPQSDTIIIRSSFFIDEPQKPSHILVYSCKQTEDSLVCDFDLPKSWVNLEPFVVEYFNRRLSIPPNDIISLEIPIRDDYVETEVYLKVQILVLYQRNVYIFRKKTNKIFISKNIWSQFATYTARR